MNNKQHVLILVGDPIAKENVAKLIIDKHDFVKVSLEEDMKNFIENVFGWSTQRLDNTSETNSTPDYKWARPCNECNVNKFPIAFCATCYNVKSINDNSARKVLQTLSNDWGRKIIHPDIWSMAAKPKIEKLLRENCNVVISDAEFHNDCLNIKNWFCAKVICVKNTSAPVHYQYVDYTINFDKTQSYESMPLQIINILETIKQATY